MALTTYSSSAFFPLEAYQETLFRELAALAAPQASLSCLSFFLFLLLRLLLLLLATHVGRSDPGPLMFSLDCIGVFSVPIWMKIGQNSS